MATHRHHFKQNYTHVIYEVRAAGDTRREIRYIVAAADGDVRLPVCRACAVTVAMLLDGESVTNRHNE